MEVAASFDIIYFLFLILAVRSFSDINELFYKQNEFGGPVI